MAVASYGSYGAALPAGYDSWSGEQQAAYQTQQLASQQANAGAIAGAVGGLFTGASSIITAAVSGTKSAVPSIMSYQPVPVQSPLYTAPTSQQQVATVGKQGFFAKYGMYLMAFGLVVAAGGGFFFYKKRKK